MVVEDNQDIRQLFQQILTDKGYEVVAVEDGGRAVQLLESLSEKPEIIVIDYHMPTMNGLELTKEILSRDPHSKILMVTGDPRVDAKIASKWGIKLRVKPITKRDLVSEVDSLNELLSQDKPLPPQSLNGLLDAYPQTSGRNRLFVQENEIRYELKI